ncbi:MAG TPA: condensation domain-containing protein, partial [Micromonospora sp.]
ILVRDLGALYRAALTGEPDGLPTLTADFVDISRWERDHLAAESTRRMVRDWAEQVRPYAVPVRLPTDRPRAEAVSAAGATLTETVPSELVDVVGGYAAHRNVTPFVVYAAAFAALVHELTGAPGVMLTVPVANRTDPRFAEVVGVFTHSPWLAVELAGVRSFDELVDRTAAATWQLLALQSVPLPMLNEALGEPFTGNPPRVFLAMLDLADPVLALPGVEPAPARDVPMPGARADQTWYLRPLPGGGLSLVAEYATALFDPGTVHRLADRWQQLLRQALTDPAAWPPPAPEAAPAQPGD